MWVSGSLMASMMVRSSSVSLPSITSWTCLPRSCAMSCTIRGNFAQTLPMGCMRVFITLSCNSVVMVLIRCAALSNVGSLACEVNCTIWLRASTSSPTRFISLSSWVTSTRMAVSETGVPRPGIDALSTAAVSGAAGGHAARRRGRNSGCDWRYAPRLTGAGREPAPRRTSRKRRSPAPLRVSPRLAAPCSFCSKAE